MSGRRAGMTLVELLVTLAVTGLMVAAGSTAFVQIARSKTAIVDANSEAERGAALRELIHGWLQSGTVSNPAAQVRAAQSSQTVQTINGEITVNPAVVSGDEIRFVTRARTPLNCDSTMMRLFIDDDDGTPERGLTLEYQVSNTTARHRVQLDTAITYMTVEFRNTQNNQWYEYQDAIGSTPKGVRLTLFPSDSVSASGIISLPIVMPMGANATAAPGQGQTTTTPGGL